MSIRTFSHSLLVLTAFLGLQCIATAQYATVTGTVTDAGNALVRGAAIGLKNVQNGSIFTTISTEAGNYAISNVPVGAYELAVSASGFKTYRRLGLTFAAQQVARVDVPLEIGSATESVTVIESTPLLKTENGEISHNVTIAQLNTLPILQLGGVADSTNRAGYRDPYALVRTIPGVLYQPNSVMVVNGAPNGSAQYRIDGQTAQSTGLQNRLVTSVGQPSADAIQEVAVQTSNYAAEFGTATAVFNVTMKSGTNQFHGSVYDYAANEILNAHQPYSGVRNSVRRHNYGLTFGGPVKIPKLYDGTNRTFFFWGWERYREDITVRTALATVPTEQYRAGNLQQMLAANGFQPVTLSADGSPFVDPLGRSVTTGSIFDPDSGRNIVCPTSGATCAAGSIIPTSDPFPNNMIPVARFDPVAVRVLELVPLPNVTNGLLFNNRRSSFPNDTRSQIPSIKINQVVNSRNRMDFYYQATSVRSPRSVPGEGLPAPITAAIGNYASTHTYRLNWDHSLTPMTLLHFGVGWYQGETSNRAPVTNYDAEAELGLRGATIKRHFPSLTIGASSISGGLNSLGPLFQSESLERRPSGIAQATHVRGRHTFKLGGEWRGERYPAIEYGLSAGSYGLLFQSTAQPALTGVNVTQGALATGSAYASFLLGNVSTYGLSVPASTQIGKQQWNLFLQDSWKLTRRLTVDYGVRWDYGTYAREKWGRNVNFSPETPNPSAGGHPGAQIFEATCRCNFADNYPYAIGPRLGVAYQWNTKTVLRGGIGVVYAPTGLVVGQSGGTVTGGSPISGSYSFLLKDGIPQSVQPHFPIFEPNAGQPDGAVVAAPRYLDPNAGRPARQLQWSFGVQREINKDMVIEAAYVANRGTWWPAQDLAPLNVISEQTLARYGFSVGNTADRELLTRPLGTLTVAQRSTLQSRGVVLPYGNYPLQQTVRNSLNPYPQYQGTIAPSLAPLGNTWYDSLQITANKRYSRGLMLNANYTWSKTLERMNSLDVFNRDLGKDLAQYDIPHILRVTFEYVVPNLRNGGVPVLSNRFMAFALSGWGMAWNLQYQSAFALRAPASQGANPIFDWLGRGPGLAQWNGQSLWSTNWVDYDGKPHTDPLDVNCHCFDPATTILLNKDAWNNVPAAQWAASMSTIREYRNIRQPNESANLSRNFRIKEGISLNIRVEFQNVFNRTRLAITNISGFATSPNRLPNGTYSNGFGTINLSTGTPGARTGLFIGRLIF